MPRGSIHAGATMIIGALGSGAMLASGMSTKEEAAAFAIGATVGLVVTPDLDMPYLTSSHSRVRRKSIVLAALWLIIWLPYGLLIPHRSPLSHWPVIGTIGRLLYMGVIVGILTVAVNTFGYQSPEIPVFDSELVKIALASLLVVDAAHFMMDKTL